MKVLELFAGTRSIGKAFEKKQHEVFSVEWDKNFDDIKLYIDIGELTSEQILKEFGRPDVIWASPDCTSFSIAAISHHRRKNEVTGNLDPVSDYAKFCDKVDQHVLELIKELNPKFWFIENPRAAMRKMTWMKGLPRYTVTYCKYGDKRMKPSDIDKDAIVSYAAIHHGLTEEMVRLYSSYPTREDMVKELTEKNIGYDFMKDKPYDWSKIERKKNQYELCKYWLATHLQNNLGDISKITELPECDLLTFSFPCQSISLAGKQEGIVENETRSGLVYEIVRLINVAKENNNLPKYLLLENVSNLVAKKFINDFNNLNEFFDEIGYNVYWKVLNSKDCGIPQSRDRVFAIYIRKDIDEIAYEFPKPFYTGLTLKDILEPTLDNVKIVDDTYKNRPVRVYSNYSPSIRSERSGFKVLETVNAYEDGTSRTIKSQYYKTSQANFERTGTFGATGVKEDSVIRKLSPIECFKLMGLTSDDANKCSDVGISSTSLYKQAGNGIVTNCISLLSEHLYKAQYDSEYKCYDDDFNSELDKSSNKIIKALQLEGSYDYTGRVYSVDGISPTVMSNSHGKTSGGYNAIKILVSSEEK